MQEENPQIIKAKNIAPLVQVSDDYVLRDIT